MTSRELSALILLGAIWGASFMFMRVAAPEFGVVPLVVLRTSLAALVFVPFLLARGGARQMLSLWRPLCVLGAINTAIPFALFNFASLHLQAAVLAILNATAPMFAAFVAFIWLKDRLHVSAVWGLIIGFGGVVLISLDKTVGNQISIAPVLAVIAAACCYGWGACIMKKWLTGARPVAVAAGSQLWASLLLAPVALAQLPPQWPSSLAWVNALALAIGGTGLAYLLYFYLIGSAGPAKAVMVGYLVPLFGIIWGVLLLDEVPSLWDFAGGGLILLGITLTSGIAQRMVVLVKRRLVVD
ncbi:DMT family transporter [Alteromonas gilva]|uniref:DMT family transporter n=1 Tax=Alteromonas gilva TaxID=2987522 RepID=A0ABT5L0U4_9ALTE|nr:DMT family transporter [Alteromonas gilva]MDC8829492.1 DMT family transporter [Alteromonas gilva]